MGIRIHKMLGYALTDVVDGDPRINWDSKIFQYHSEGREVLEEFLEFSDRISKPYSLSGIDKSMITSQLAAIDAGEKIPWNEKYDVQNSFAWGTSDGGLNNVFCIKPVTCADWYRFDDIMDYVEENYIHSPGGVQDRVNVIPHGHYPYSGIYMDKRTGERIKGYDINAWVRAWTNLPAKEQKKIMKTDPSLFDDFSSGFGMTHVEAVENVAPFVPEDVRNVADFMDVFTSPDVWKELRPVIYTWWA